MKDFYEHYWEERGSSGFRPRYRLFIDWIDRNDRILDIGCGDGYFGELLVKEKGVVYQGIDIAETAVQKARHRGLDVRTMDIEKDLHTIPDKHYDIVVISEVIEHVVHAEDILKELKRIAKKGVIVSIPNIAYWKFRLQLLTGSFPKQWAVAPQEHLRYWSVSDFIHTVEQIGFMVDRVQASNGRKPLRDWWPNMFGLQVCFYLR